MSNEGTDTEPKRFGKADMRKLIRVCLSRCRMFKFHGGSCILSLEAARVFAGR